jgi:hypothetical protein
MCYRFGASQYRIRVGHGLADEPAQLMLDGVVLEDGVPLLDDGAEHEVLLRTPPA